MPSIFELTNANLMDIKIKKHTVKSTLPKKAKIRFGVEFDTTIKYVKAPKL
jgi:hypothetical protein